LIVGDPSQSHASLTFSVILTHCKQPYPIILHPFIPDQGATDAASRHTWPFRVPGPLLDQIIIMDIATMSVARAVLQCSMPMQTMLPALASAPFHQLVARSYATNQQFRSPALPSALAQQGNAKGAMNNPLRTAPLTPISRGFASQGYRRYGQQDFTQVLASGGGIAVDLLGLCCIHMSSLSAQPEALPHPHTPAPP
jgi:hypothetical protein